MPAASECVVARLSWHQLKIDANTESHQQLHSKVMSRDSGATREDVQMIIERLKLVPEEGEDYWMARKRPTIHGSSLSLGPYSKLSITNLLHDNPGTNQQHNEALLLAVAVSLHATQTVSVIL